MTGSNEPKGLSTARIETLTDGVFAIAMTLLVLNIGIPAKGDYPSLSAGLMDLWPKFIAYVVSFLVITVYWVGHHYQFYWIKKSTRALLWINVFFLMSIAFVPFSTALLAAYDQEMSAVFIYGFNVIICGLLLYIHWAYASEKAKLIPAATPKAVVKTLGSRIIIGMGFYLIATLLAFFSTKISLVLFVILPFLYMLPSKVIDSHILSNG